MIRIAPRLSFLVSLATLSYINTAHAQVRWDIGAQAGAMRRVLTDRPSGGSDAAIGPYTEIRAQVALIPLVRVGAYLAEDMSPVGDATLRHVTSAGIRSNLLLPWPTPTKLWRTYAFAAFGYSSVYAPSYHTRDAVVAGSGGGFFEVPVGLQVAYNVRTPVWFTAELGARFAFADAGNFYAGRTAFTTAAVTPLPPLGTDAYAVYLAVGARWEL